MKIETIKVTQRKLKRKEQLQDLIKSIQNNEYIEPIILHKQPDDSVHCIEGHHRLIAYYLAGKHELEDYEYELILADNEKPCFGTVKNFIERNESWIKN